MAIELQQQQSTSPVQAPARPRPAVYNLSFCHLSSRKGEGEKEGEKEVTVRCKNCNLTKLKKTDMFAYFFKRSFLKHFRSEYFSNDELQSCKSFPLFSDYTLHSFAPCGCLNQSFQRSDKKERVEERERERSEERV